MIGALLSNTPANLLKSNGVAGELRSSPEENNPGREGLSARDSQASQRAAAIQAGSSPPLTAEAILALQQADSPGGSRARAPGSQADSQSTDGAETGAGAATVSEADTGSAASADSGAQSAEGGGGAAGAVQGQSDPEEEDDPDGDGLNSAEEKQVEELKQRDMEVRAHEQAHARVGGAHAGAPSYTFQQGPDGKRYAIGGEVQIDTSKERTPEATIRKMQVVMRAATAPAEPSSQDLKVAQLARTQLSEAQAELRQQKAEELSGEDEVTASAAAPAGNGPPESNGPPEGNAQPGDEEQTGTREGEGRLAEAGIAISAYQSASQSTARTGPDAATGSIVA